MRDENVEGGRGGIVIYNDSNNNSILDPAEERTTTDELGVYHLILDGGTDYTLRAAPRVDYQASGEVVHTGTVGIGRSEINLDFGATYSGTSWHNSQQAANVDGVNGVTPIDALLVINELTSRDLSDPSTGALPELSDPPSTLQFVDVDENGFVSPIDALLVVNALSGPSPAAASSAAFAVPEIAESEQDESNEDDRLSELHDLALQDLL
jgi:hypothetical protein